MDQETKNILSGYYEKLPDNVKNVLAAPDLKDRLLKISQKSGLRADAAAGLEDEVAMVLLGLEHPNDLMQNLKQNISVDRPTLQRIVGDINREILRPIRKSLISLHKEEGTTQQTTNNRPDQETNKGPLGVERTMPRDIMKAKLSQQTQTKVETKQVDENRGYDNDPYREPIE